MKVQDNIIFYPLMGVVTTGIVVLIKTEMYLIYQTIQRNSSNTDDYEC
jgi:hypothetical protein